MKKIKVLVLIAFFGTCAAFSQDRNIVTFSPLGLVNKVKFKYEHSFNNNISVGGFAAMYYGLYPGVQIAPFGRYYFGEEGPEGVYLQAKLLAGFHQYEYVDETTGNNAKKPFSSYGGGLGIGYQRLTGKNKNIAIDVAIGFKLMTPPIQSNNQIYTDVNSGVYLLTGPGSLYDGLLSVGLSF